MLKDLAIPVAENIRSQAGLLRSHTWGKNLRFYRGEPLGADCPPIALMGVGGPDNAPAALDAVRPYLYALTDPSRNAGVMDMGNIAGGAFGLMEACEELLTKGILPLVVAGPGEWSAAQARAFERFRRAVNIVSVDSRMDLSLSADEPSVPGSYLDELLLPDNEWLFHFANVGCQWYYLDPAVLDWMDRRGYDYFRLGRLRENIEEAEPEVRDADLMLFHLRAMRAADMQDSALGSPSGLTVEDACRIARYAGMSDKLGAAGFYGLPDEPSQIVAMTTAQILWHFVEGYGRRMRDYPFDKTEFTGFVVDLKSESMRLHFWKSNRSDRWWVEPPKGISLERARHSPVSCSYGDYLLACEGELSLRLARAFSRF